MAQKFQDATYSKDAENAKHQYQVVIAVFRVVDAQDDEQDVRKERYNSHDVDYVEYVAEKLLVRAFIRRETVLRQNKWCGQPHPFHYCYAAALT